MNVVVGQEVALRTMTRSPGAAPRIDWGWKVDKVTKTRIDITKVVAGELLVRSIYPYTGAEMVCPRNPGRHLSDSKFYRPTMIWQPEVLAELRADEVRYAKLRNIDTEFRHLAEFVETADAGSAETVREALAGIYARLATIQTMTGEL